MKKFPSPIFAWIDLETNGLETDRHEILEVAVILTTRDLEVLASYEAVVKIDSYDRVASEMNPHVVEMHTESGLLDALRSPDTVSLADIEADVIELLRAHQVGVERPVQAILGGSSVHFDRSFIKEQMRVLDEYLHYRLLDVSAFKVAFPELYRNRTSGPKHRAMDDIEFSIYMLRVMRGHLGHLLD